MTRREHPTSPVTISRRSTLGSLGLAFTGILTARSVLAQESTPESTPAIESNAAGEMPTTGGLRPGPVGQQPPVSNVTATLPISIIVEAAGIDAEIEVLNIVDGKMEDPTGPWVVSWYQQSAELGEPGNILLAGHVDYWGVGPSVFYNVRDLVENDRIDLTGANGEVFSYAVASVETYSVDDLVSGMMAEIVAPTDTQTLTLITCGGEFDYVNGEYLSRTVVRGERIPPTPPDATPES